MSLNLGPEVVEVNEEIKDLSNKKNVTVYVTAGGQ
jgi:hypothetical protein